MLSGFPLDDAWIHQVVARTFATTGTLGYMPGRFGSGSTSYAWAAFLAPNFLILHANPVRYTFALTSLLWLATGQGVLRALLHPKTNTTFDFARAALTAGLACVGGNFLWFVFSGMEATLFTALSVGAISLFATLEKGGRRRAIVAAVCLFVLTMTRPEAIGIGLLLIPWSFRDRTPKREATIALSGWVLGSCAYVLINVVATGQVMPRTLEGRKWMWLGTEAGRSGASIASELPTWWAARIRDYTLGTSSHVVFFFAVGLAFVGLYEINRKRLHGARLLVAWTLLHFVTFAIFMPAMGHGGRYQPLIPFVFVLLATFGTATLMRTVVHRVMLLPTFNGELASPHEDMLAVASATAIIVPILGLGIARWRVAEPLAIDHIRTTEIGLAEEFRKLPPAATIASFDIGAAGFFGDRALLDLGGLTDPAIVPLLRDGLAWTYLRDHHVDYVALPLGYDDSIPDLFNFGYRLHLFDSPHIALEPVAFLESPKATWVPGITSTMHSAPRQGIYRVTFPAVAPASTSLLPNATAHVLDAEDLLTLSDRSELIYAAAAIARAGIPIDVRIANAPSNDSPRTSDVLALDVRPDGVRAYFPPQLSRLPANEMERIWRDGVADYVRVGDLSGMAREALFLLTVVVKRYVDPTFDPLLAPTPPPNPAMSTGSARSDGRWGWPFSILIAAVFLFLKRQRALDAARSLAAFT